MKAKLRYISLILVVAAVLGLFSGVTAAKYDPNPMMRVGLLFGSSSTDSFTTISSAGFEIGYTSSVNGTVFTPLYTTAVTSIAVARDENLVKNSSGKYVVEQSSVDVGKLHVEFGNEFATMDLALAFITELVGQGVTTAFPCYINGIIKVRCDDRSTQERASQSLESVRQKTGGKYTLSIGASSANAVTVINTSGSTILFEVDCPDKLAAVRALSSGSGTAYISTTAGNIYPGAFEYRRTTAGIELINILPLEDYVKGVLPYEISTSWPEEALKAFSVVVRSYSVYSMTRHSSQGFMVCSDAHCQVYSGHKRATEASSNAVDATKGMVATYNGKPIDAVYHSSSGGVTTNHNEAWSGGSLTHPYLQSVKTPFENYALYNNGKWISEESSSALFTYFTTISSYKSRFSSLKGGISRIVPEYSPVSGYVNKLTVYDYYGNSGFVTTSDAVRMCISSRYVNSANMVIYNRVKYKVNELPDPVTLDTYGLNVVSAQGLSTYNGMASELAVISAAGVKSPQAGEYTYVFDGKGWGHGVGLSQYGLLDLSKLGTDWQTIVKTYYTGVSIVDISTMEK